MVYFNGVLIFSISIKHHLKKIVRIVKEHGLVESASKMKLFQTKERFLGQYISRFNYMILGHIIT